MKVPVMRTPLELPRQTLYQKHYSAVLCGDGRILPIEERLGRRLLRTIEAPTPEGAELLRRGWVALRTLEGKALENLPLSRVYARLKEEVSERLAERPHDASWCSHYSGILETVRQWEERLLTEQQNH